MSFRKTYIDSGVLIAIARALDKMMTKALEILDDRQRIFVSSPFVNLEVLPKAIYYQQQEEITFYEGFFSSCSFWANDLDSIVQLAQNIASRYGIGALDALRIASAISVSTDELITTEKITKPIHRAREVQVISIND